MLLLIFGAVPEERLIAITGCFEDVGSKITLFHLQRGVGGGTFLEAKQNFFQHLIQESWLERCVNRQEWAIGAAVRTNRIYWQPMSAYLGFVGAVWSTAPR
jgi:hypothetical protein